MLQRELWAVVRVDVEIKVEIFVLCEEVWDGRDRSRARAAQRRRHHPLLLATLRDDFADAASPAIRMDGRRRRGGGSSRWAARRRWWGRCGREIGRAHV